MTLTRYPRPCPIPGHPQDEEESVLVTESAWARLRAWHLHAPAERLPLPLALLAWPAAWLLHAVHVPGHLVAYVAGAAAVLAALIWRRRQDPDHPRLADIEAAAVAAAAGGWLAAAVTWGPSGWPHDLLTWIYIAGSAAGYWWLRRHEAVRAARARRDKAAEWTGRKAWWHGIAHQLGLSDFHLQSVTPTRLGEELLLTSAPGAERVSRVLSRADAITETLAHILGLRYGRIELRGTDLPGQLVISIREQAPTVDGPVIHPALDPGSPYAPWFGEHRSIRNPVPVGVIPETGEPMELVLWDAEGGKAIGVYSMTGGGKTNMLDVIREAVTVMDDAVLVNINGAGSGDERAWEPLSLLTAAGLQADNPELQGKISGALRWVRNLIGQRAETAADTGDSVFQPTRADPAVVVIIDEIDETGKIDGASKILEFLASKQRKAAVCLILAGQRATATWTGGAGVRINLSTVVTGMLARESEGRHAVGAENEIPDIAEYSGGEAGFFQIWSTRAKKILARGRSFYIGSIGEQQHIISRRDPAGRPVLAGAAEAAAPAPAAPRDQPGTGLRDRLAHVRELNEGHPLPARTGALPVVPGVPPEAMAVLMRLLAAPSGTTAGVAGPAIGRSKSTTHEYLAAMRDRGIAEMTGSGRGSRFRLARAEPLPVPSPPGSGSYLTIGALAQAVHEGRVDADEEQRAVLEQVWQLTGRPRLTLVPPLPEGEGDSR